jgi:hypothetical protein
MAHVVFTSHLQRFVSCAEHDVEGHTLGGVPYFSFRDLRSAEIS